MGYNIVDYKDLRVWQHSIEFVALIYKITKELPCEEQYGLTSQMRRAAVSIPSNIAEGSRRYSYKEFSKFIRNALGSLSEVETQIIICIKIGLLTNQQTTKINALSNQIGKMLMKLHHSLKNKKQTTT